MAVWQSMALKRASAVIALWRIGGLLMDAGATERPRQAERLDEDASVRYATQASKDSLQTVITVPYTVKWDPIQPDRYILTYNKGDTSHVETFRSWGEALLRAVSLGKLYGQ